MRRAATGMLAMTLVTFLGALAHEPVMRLTAAVPDRFTLSSALIDETGLTYVGPADVTIGSTTTTTMKFTITGATMHGMDMTTECRSSFTLQSTVADPDTAVIGAATLYLTSFSFMLSGSPQSFTVAQPPNVGYSLPTDTLDTVEMVGMRADMSSVTLHHLAEHMVAC